MYRYFFDTYIKFILYKLQYCVLVYNTINQFFMQ